MSTITLYTKPGCHLCEGVEQVIDHVRRDIPFDLIKRNILDDPTDLKTYGELIPVVLVDGAQHTFWRVNEDRLRKALTG